MPDLPDGGSTEVPGSGSAKYTLRNVGGAYSCSCPAWRNQSDPPDRRTCKHLRKFRGDAAEDARLGTKPAPAVPADPAAPLADETAGPGGPPLLLAETWDTAADLTGWYLSEKLDGVRAYWDGKQFLSRLGNRFKAPDWFTQGLPAMALDGELWVGRGKFSQTVSVVRRPDASDHWAAVRYCVFDAPGARGTFENRAAFLEDALPKWKAKYAGWHPHSPCKSLDHLRAELARVEKLGGEGLMLRRPDSKYEVGRSSSLVKVKSFKDAEAVVLGYEPGQGRHAGRVGAIRARLADGTEFKVGTGLTDRDREAPPAVGETITVRYQELTEAGVPRFPSYVGARIDAPPPPPKPVPVAKPAPAKAATGGPRRFECTEGGASKFWAVAVTGVELTVSWGRIGSAGQTKTKGFASAAAAQAEADKLVREKLGGGYVER